MGAYNASNWGVRSLTKCIAMEVGPFGTRVNSLHPGAWTCGFYLLEKPAP